MHGATLDISVGTKEAQKDGLHLVLIDKTGLAHINSIELEGAREMIVVQSISERLYPPVCGVD